MATRFFDRFRTAQRRYASGVHELGACADRAALDEAEARVGKLPAVYRDFLEQWNGGFLFHDDYALWGVGGARADLMRIVRVELPPPVGAVWEIGLAPDRALYLDDHGRVLVRDLDGSFEDGELTVEGSSFERWIDALMAREGVIYDRDGEFREEAFDGGDLSDAARRKRAQVALKADPDSPAWRMELAELFEEGGEPESAAETLVRVVELEPGAAPAWRLLGRLRRELGDHAGASAAFASGAAVERDPAEQAFAWASAARAAEEAGLDGARALGERANAAMPDFVAQQRTAATHLLEEGDLDGAVERLTLALAAAPDDAELRGELGRVRARRSLRTLAT